MRNLTPNIRGDMTLQNSYSVKKELWNCLSENWFIELCLVTWNKYFPSLRIFATFYTYIKNYEELFMFSECGLIRFQLILKNRWLSLMVHTIQNLETSNLNPGFEFQ
jgi:hypothetical protein